MARIKGGVLRGKVGPTVSTVWNGIEVVRALPQRPKNAWSEPQLLHSKSFKSLNVYCGKYRYSLIPQIWNLSAQYGHAYNAFLKANSAAFALDGKLTDVEKLHFSS